MAFIDAAKIPPTGHPRIDAGHREMAEQVNSLYEMWQSGAPHADVVRSLDLLLRVVGRHFAEEEEIGRAIGYDGMDRHQGRHRELLGELTTLVDGLRGATGYSDRAIDAFALIDSLLYEHEIVDDQDYWLLFHDGVPAEAAPADQPLIALDEGLSTGIAAVDRDHEALVDLINALARSLRADAGPATVRDLLDRLVDHSRRHFAKEEAMMEAADAPGLEGHRILHEHLLSDLDAVIAQYGAGRYADLEDLLQTYLKFWLIDHIRNVDARTLPGASGFRAPEAAEPGEG